MATFSEIAGNRFISKRTKSGLVIRELERGVAIRQWFVPVDKNDDLGIPKKMSLSSQPVFEPVNDEQEIEKILFFARRAYNRGVI